MHILTEALIDEAPQIAMDVMGFSQKFQIQLGWHYILDLSWILERLQDLPVPSRILDAGAGNGLLQYILASMEHTVVSVDVFRALRHPAPRHAFRCATRHVHSSKRLPICPTAMARWNILRRYQHV